MSVFLVCCIILLCLWLAGCFFAHVLKIQTNNYSLFAIGFIGQLGLLEATGWFLVAFRQSALAFSILTCSIFIISCTGGFFLIFYKKGFGFSEIKKISGISLESVILFAVLIVSAYCVIRYYRPDADDAFYVSNVLMFSNEARINQYDASFGIHDLSTVPMYDFQVWEAFLSVLCRLSGVSAAVLCHLAMPLILLVVSCSAYVHLGEKLTHDTQRAYLFAVLVLILCIFGGYSTQSKGSFLLSRLWQGKATYLHVHLPVIEAFALDNNSSWKEKSTIKLSLVLLGITLAGIAMNPTSIYVLGFAILCIRLALCLRNRTLKPWLPVLPSIGAVLFFALMIYLRTKNYSRQIETASTVPEGFFQLTLSNFIGTGGGLFVFGILACIYFFTQGNNDERVLLGGMPLILVLVCLNPLMAPIIAKKVTMVPSFWRVCWLLPVDYALAMAFVRFRDWVVIHLQYCKNSQTWITLFTVGLFTLCNFGFGSFLFTPENGFLVSSNSERIGEEQIQLGKIMVESEDSPILLAEDYSATVMRQVFPQVEMIYSRYNYVLDLFEYRGDHQQAQDRLALLSFVNIEEDGIWMWEDIYRLLDKYNVGWVLLRACPKWKATMLGNDGYVVIGMTGEYTLWCKNPSRKISVFVPRGWYNNTWTSL